MKVIGINGSPRRNGNTMTLVQEVLSGAAKNGAETKLVNLNRLTMKGCQNCDACKKDPGNCVQKDDLSPLLKELMDYDAIVLGTPVYWFQVSSQVKALIDRFYCYSGADSKSVFPTGKKFLVVTSKADVEEPQFKPELYQYMNEWLQVVLSFMSPESVEFLHHHGSFYNKDSAGGNDDLMAKAALAGASLTQV